ncbi:MAG: AraC family transcriptional regulator [Bacillota bacterium]|nr:AraC family transcriptional regulator [Bacillota bacterium]
MDNQAYYRIQDQDGCDIDSTDYPLLINCAGVNALSRPFTTWRPHGRHDYYLMYVSQGELTLYLHGHETVFQAGQFVIFRPGCATRYSKSDHKAMTYYWIHFTGSAVPEVLVDCSIQAETRYDAGVSQQLIDDFHRLFDNFLYRDQYLQPAAAALLVLILVRLRRKAEGQLKKPTDVTPERISQSLAYIHKHYSQAITIRELAELEHLSASRYSALFRACMGQSPQSFIIDLRLRMAIELLQRTDLTVKQVAHTVGYDDQLYFSRLFRSRKGVAPSHYQQHFTELISP